MNYKKCQASFEYMLVVGIMFIGLSGAVFFFISYQKTSEQELDRSKLNYVVEIINRETTESFYTTGIYKKELKYQLPQGITRIYTYNNTHNTSSFIVFETFSHNYTYALNTPVCANITQRFNTGRIIIEKGFGQKYTNLCTFVDASEKCNCEWIIY
jgi:uncharacterized protein (UPF0333 family)